MTLQKTQKNQNRLDNAARAASWILIAWVWLSLIASAMTLVFWKRIGFWPVWYGDCAMCSNPPAIAYTVPLVGGISVLTLIAIAVSVTLLLRRVPPPAQRVLFLVGLLATGLQVAVFIDQRYPGSLPQLFAAVLPPFAAAGFFAVALSRPQTDNTATFASARPNTKVLTFLSLAVLAQLALGGVLTLVAAIAGFFAYPSRESTADTTLVVLATIHTFLAFGARYTITQRFAHLIDSVWF